MASFSSFSTPWPLAYQANQRVLSLRMTLLSRTPVPSNCFNFILGHASAMGVAGAQSVLSLRMTLLSRKPVPSNSFDFVFGHAVVSRTPLQITGGEWHRTFTGEMY